MIYNFDEVINRRKTNSIKWDDLESKFGYADLYPMWVADMDFYTPPFVLDVIQQKLNHGILGYTLASENWFSSIITWLQRKHQWKVEKNELCFIPGIVRGIAYSLQCFTQPKDKVMVLSPIYPPFFLVSERNKREVVHFSLGLENGQYVIDFKKFEQQIDGCKALLLANPHNPGGRVWTEDELKRIAEICWEKKVLVISDEIHADLTLPDFTHIPFAKVSEKAKLNSVVFMSPSKAFNMAGLGSSYSVIQNPQLQQEFHDFLEASALDEGHVFAYETVAAAYTQGEEWLTQVLAYIQENIDFTERFLNEQLPRVGMIRPQASFLIFLDCRKLHLTQSQLEELFAAKAHLALNSGTSFGKEGEGFMRLNIGCPRSELERALLQLKKAVEQC